MNISAILVATTPEYLEQLKVEIDAIEWAEVHHVEEQGRMIITIEGKDLDEDLERIKFLNTLPGVITASMIQYYFEDEMEGMWESVHSKDPNTIPAYLDNDDLNQKAPGIYQSMKGLANP